MAQILAQGTNMASWDKSNKRAYKGDTACVLGRQKNTALTDVLTCQLSLAKDNEKTKTKEEFYSGTQFWVW